MYDHTTTATGAAIVQLLLATHPALLSHEEIVREIGDRVAVDDTLAYLQRMGLAHKLNGFWWATRAMMAGEEAATLRP